LGFWQRVCIVGWCALTDYCFAWLAPNILVFVAITYSLRGMRHAFLQGYSLSALGLDIVALAVFSVVVLSLGIFCFRYAVRKAKMEGSLTQY
jgi:ABC-2 type transport system permease protein